MSERDSRLLGELLDERAITAVLHDYARALDTRDWGLLASLFVPRAVVDYSAEGGPICVGAEAVVADCQADFTGLDATQHLICNIAISLRGDSADASCYLLAWHHTAESLGGADLILAGGYRDRLVRAEDGWKFTRRSLQVAFQTGNADVKVPRAPEQSH